MLALRTSVIRLFNLLTGCLPLLHGGVPQGDGYWLSLKERVIGIKVIITHTCTIFFLDWVIL